MQEVAGLGVKVGLNSAEFQQNAAAARRSLRSLAEGAASDLKKMETGFAGFSKATGAALGQVGFQLQDIIVQLQGGARPLQVFVQQGSQIAGAFGPIGAILGTAGSAAAILASSLLGFNRTAEKTPSVLSGLTSGMDAAKDSADAFSKALQEANEQGKQLLQRFAEIERNRVSVQAGPDVEAITAQIRARVQQAVFDRIAREEAERISDVPAGARIAKRTAEEGVAAAEAAAKQIEAAVRAGDTAGLDALLVKFNLLTDETVDFVKALQAAAGQIQGLNQAQSSAALTRRSRQGDGSFASPIQAYARVAPIPSRREDSAAAAEAAADAQRDAKAATDAQTAALKRQGQTVENLTDAVAKLHAHYRSKPDPSLVMGAPANKDQLTDRLHAERESMDALAKYQEEVRKDQAEQTRRLADLQSDILIEPWRNMADEVSGIADDMFSSLLSKGEISGKALGEGLTQSINSSLANLGSTLVTAPLQKAIAEIGSGQYSGFMDFAQQNPGLVAGTAGVAAGQVGGQLLGLDGKYAGLGGTVGASLGFMVGGPIGALAGGFLGSMAGGLFGGENNLGNDRSTQTYSGSAGDIVYSDRSFSQGNRNVTSGILGEVQAIQEALKDLGASFSDFNLRVEAGNKSGIAVNGVKYDTAQDALKGAIEQLLGARTGGLTTTQQTILANTKGENAQQIGQDLAFGETYDKLIRGGNQFEQALQGLYETFRDATTEAEKLGLSTDGLTQAHIREFNEVNRQKEQAQRGVYEQIAAARGDNSLGTQLFMLETRMRELAKAAADLGIPLETVTEAQREAARRLTEVYYENIEAMQAQQRGLQQSILEARRGAVGAVDQYLDPIKAALGSQGIGRGVYAGTVTTASAVDEFRALLGMAREGDTSALSQLSGAGQAAVQAARQTYGAGTEFAAIFREIEAGLQSERGQLEAKRDALMQRLGDVQQETLDEQIRTRVEIVGQLKEQADRLERELRALVEGLR